MFLPTMYVMTQPVVGYTVTGQKEYGPAAPVGITPINLISELQSSSIRADKSGSKERASEQTANYSILVAPTASLKEDDAITIMGKRYKIWRVEPTFSMSGQIDHYQVALKL
jgi:hypothetical protein